MDIGAVAAPVSFLGALAGILTYLGGTIAADRKAHAERLADERARIRELEAALDAAQQELETELRARRALERDLNTAELEMERLASRLEGYKERELDYRRAATALRSIE